MTLFRFLRLPDAFRVFNNIFFGCISHNVYKYIHVPRGLISVRICVFPVRFVCKITCVIMDFTTVRESSRPVGADDCIYECLVDSLRSITIHFPLYPSTFASFPFLSFSLFFSFSHNVDFLYNDIFSAYQMTTNRLFIVQNGCTKWPVCLCKISNDTGNDENRAHDMA